MINSKVPIFIIGDGSFAAALYHVLNLFFVECYIESSKTIYGHYVEQMTEKGNETNAKFANQLINSRLVIALTNHVDNPARIIHLVHLLRRDLGWEGGFLVVVGNNAEKQQLMETGLFGENDREFCFGKLPGHRVLCQPLLMSNLFWSVINMEIMYSEHWYSLLSKSQARSSIMKTYEAKRLLKNGNLDRAVNIMSEVIEEMQDFDWVVLLPEHSDFRLVKELFEKYPSRSPVLSSNCQSLIEEVQQLFSKSCLGSL